MVFCSEVHNAQNEQTTTAEDTSNNATEPPGKDEPPAPVPPTPVPPLINYASEDKGAVIIAHNKEGKNAGHILNENGDKYFQSDCSGRRWIVLQLSEDVSTWGTHIYR